MFSDNDNWTSLSRINLNKLFSFRRFLHQNSYQRFTQSILETYFGESVQYIHSFKIDTLNKTIYSPLWGNSLINGNGNYIINEWYNKGIRNVIDLIDENGQFYEFQGYRKNMKYTELIETICS